ncbi:RNA polymerase sigma factor ShbA [Pseudonocardia asaccharolytica]|uniref:Putative RNA polymerase sigma-D factor n=1 Tax=Pseudonocardia asaccharolytica DSM 44247 = NBRC 16224 TaxID=1123024 RepID=A0A511D9C6_9PSEU|nr:RNA polymerase sigma factor ShbA [Pseudonocardia asaccharolytica]GEL19558.1 putative RNA polymerase sigma-D factor [Pseudonocardia asaccharolytica DSM 44247 = NBRC 16224]
MPPWQAAPQPAEPGSEINQLARAAVTGDEDALTRLLAAVNPLVMRYCRARLGGYRAGLQGPEDVAQEVCLALCAALPRFRFGTTPFMAFVYAIASNKVSDAFRAARRDLSTPADELPESIDDRSGPEALALDGDGVRHISHLLDRLPEAHREILMLRLALQLSAEETAQVVGMSPGAVRVAQHRALTKLRQWIGER